MRKAGATPAFLFNKACHWFSSNYTYIISVDKINIVFYILDLMHD